jgi:capsular exopolysaccharide synthesis family protein
MAAGEPPTPNGSEVPAQVERRKSSSILPSYSALLKALQRHWLLNSMLGVFLASLASAAAWFVLPTTKPTATAVLHLSADRPSIIDDRGNSRADFSTYQVSQKTLLASRLVIAAALRRPDVSELAIVREQRDPISWLQKELKIEFRAGSEFMQLSLGGRQADELKVLLTAVTDAYLQEVVDRERNKQVQHLKQLEEVQAQYEESLRRKRKSVREMALAVGTGDPQVIAVKQRYAFEALGHAERELLRVKAELRQMKIELRGKEEKDKIPPDANILASQVEQEIDKDPTMLEYLAKKKEFESTLSRLVASAPGGKNEPTLRPLYRALEANQAAIDARRQELKPQILEQLRARAQNDAAATMPPTKDRVTFHQELEKQLISEVEALRKQAASLNVGQIDIESYKQEIAQAERISAQVAAKVETMRVELLAPSRVTLAEEAYVTQEDSLKRRLAGTAAAGLGTLVVVLGLVGWRAYATRRVESTSEVRDEIGIPVLGIVPALPARNHRQPEPSRAWRSLLTVCMDTTRTRLIHATNQKGDGVVMVTSALPREGKTSLAAHLGASLARTGRRTLLVDGDLRIPSLHRLFQLAPHPGLAEVLRGERKAAGVIQPSQIGGLWLMAAGRSDPRAIQAFARQQQLRAIVEGLRQQYDCVVVDSAPVLPVVDSVLLGQHMDAVILSVLRGVSHLPAVQAAHDRLTELNIRVIGMVVSGADPQELYGGYGGTYLKTYGHDPGSVVEDEDV